MEDASLQRYFENGVSKGIPSTMADRIRVRLNALNRAKELRDVNLPGFGFHALKRARKREYAISVQETTHDVTI